MTAPATVDPVWVTSRIRELAPTLSEEDYDRFSAAVRAFANRNPDGNGSLSTLAQMIEGMDRRVRCRVPDLRHEYVPKTRAELEPFIALAPYVLGIPLPAPLPGRLLIVLRALPIHVLGIVTGPTWGDGRLCSPAEYFYHDLDHARFKIREDLLAIGCDCADAYQSIDGAAASTLDPRSGQHRVILPEIRESMEQWGPLLWQLAPQRLLLADLLVRSLASITAQDAILGEAAELVLLEIVHEKSFPMDRKIIRGELSKDGHIEKTRRKLSSGFYGPNGPDPQVSCRLEQARRLLLPTVKNNDDPAL
jgi:hypothetical protein